MSNLLTAVSLTDEQAEMFKLFMEHYEVIKFMKNCEVFDIRNGNATLHFNQRGNCILIDKKITNSLADFTLSTG